MKKILVLCSGNSSRSQMAEGYFNYYAQGRAQFHSASLQDLAVNPLTVKVMAEDNIDISTNQSKSYRIYKGVCFDYLITLWDQAHQPLPKSISYQEHIHFPIPDPDKAEGTPVERHQSFCQIREAVKINILKFIGKELSGNPAPAIF